jgi:hypothetical protein
LPLSQTTQQRKTMSYASIASHNTSGPQPHPDPGLLNTSHSQTSLPDVDSKVTVVPQSFKEHPVTATSAEHLRESSREDERRRDARSPLHLGGEGEKTQRRKDVAKRKLHEAEDEGVHLWAVAKQRVLQPGVMGGLIGIANVGLIGAFGYQLYSKPHLRRDTRALSTAAVSALVLLGSEGYVAEAYRKTAQGQAEERRAREEGAYLYQLTRDVVLRPGVLGGLVGVVNVGILGGVGYLGYLHWDEPHWDRRTVSAVTVGLLALFAGEGYLGEEYIEHEYPRRK